MAESLYQKPDGSFVWVPAESAGAAAEAGYKPSTQEALDASNSGLQAGVEAGVRTVLPVVGQELLTGFEEGYSGKSRDEVLRGQALRRKENPVANALGSGVGFAVGPGKLLKPLQGLRAAGLGGQFAAGAVEGGLFGLEDAVNESMVDQTPLTAEKLAASTAASALAGGVIDFGMGAVSKGVSSLLKKAGGQATREALGEVGDRISRSMIDTGKWAREYGANADDVLRVARDEGVLHPGQVLSRESLPAIDEAAARTQQAVKDYLDNAQNLTKHEMNSEWKVVDHVMGQLKRDFERKPLLHDTVREVQDILDQYASQQSTWSELWDLQRNWLERGQRMTSADAEVIRSAQKSLRQYIVDNAPKSINGKSIGGSLETLAERANAMSAFRDGFADAVDKFEARGPFGTKEMLAAATAAQYGGPAGLVGAGVTGALSHSARKRGGFLVGETLRKLADSDMLGSLAQSFERNIAQRLATAPELLGPFRGALEQAASQGSMDLLETHMALARSPQGQDYLARLGIEPSSDDSLTNAGAKLAVYDALKNGVQEHDSLIASAADGLFGSAPGRKGSVGVGLSLKDFQKTMESVHAIMSDPEGMYARVPADLHGAAPMTVGAASMTLVNAARFLDSKAPKDPYAGMPASVRPEWQPDAVSLDRFARYKEAVESPARVLKNMANGYISPEQVEALQAVYPALYADLQQRIGERLAMWQKPLTYQQKLAMGALLGPQAFGMTPQQVQVLQQVQTGARGAGAMGPEGDTNGPDGRQDVNEEQIQTESQKLESR